MSREKLLHSIGEVAEKLNLQQHVLRFWESKFHQIKPIKCKGRRLYDHKCIETIKKIKHMLYDKGYTIKGVQKEFRSDIKINLNNDHFEGLLKEMIDLRNYLTEKMNDEQNNNRS
ncbi:MerR family transcriptional regulator [Wolbachia endosymbiont of Chironomus riparius]|uniref:MerR family transcriptional regulator n=1 Tax=Wolbachia endosymbiont of Chironomus riparius TaxID=2883238 RepID=UPI00209D8DEF|nr:MerR family transcriptional regulator [Wolbachia endosymbiont of Chironomus riparius]